MAIGRIFSNVNQSPHKNMWKLWEGRFAVMKPTYALVEVITQKELKLYHELFSYPGLLDLFTTKQISKNIYREIEKNFLYQNSSLFIVKERCLLKMYLAVLWICDRVFDADLRYGIHIS